MVNITNKKAYLKTLEATIAVVITFSILFFLMQKTPTTETTPSQEILKGLQNNDAFRNCALQLNLTCINQTIYERMPNAYKTSYFSDLTNNPNFIPEGLPQDKQVKTESTYIAANTTQYSPIIVKLFYWA